MKIYNYTVIFDPVKEGGYNIIVPAIPEICTFGETLKEAKAMAADAIKCFIESALKANETIPA
jgi:antitoxin HicB